MNICRSLLLSPSLEVLTCGLDIDIHLQNVLFKLPSSFDQLSIDQLYEKYGTPNFVAVERRNGKPLPSNVPSKVVVPVSLGFSKDAEKITLSEARILLGDFGEAFAPASIIREGKDCHIPLGMRPPEARFELNAPLSFPADIWSLALAIWDILGMRSLFNTDFVHPEELVSEYVDSLGPMPAHWWESWEKRIDYFEEDESPKQNRIKWYSLVDCFGENVQKDRRSSSDVDEFEADEVAAILELMRQMLRFQPDERSTAEQVLNSEWMVKWGLPCFERSLGGGVESYYLPNLRAKPTMVYFTS